MATPRDDARALAQRQRAGNDWFSHDSPAPGDRCDTPRSGRGTGEYSKKYGHESEKWYDYQRSPTKDAATSAISDDKGSGDADSSVAVHDKAFIEESTAAAEVAAVESAPEPPAAEPVPKLDISESESEPSSPEKKPSKASPTKTPKGEATEHKKRGHNMSEDWYHYSEKQIGKQENGPGQSYNFDVKGLKSETSNQAAGYKSRNKGSASDWYKHGQQANGTESTPTKEGQVSPTKKRDQVDLSSKEAVRDYAAQAKAGSAGSWFGHAGGEYTPKKQGKPRVTEEGHSYAERDKGSFSIFTQESSTPEPIHSSRRGANRGSDSVGGLLGGN